MRLLILIICLLGVFNHYAQTKLLKTIETNATKIAVDNLDNYYLYNHSKIDKYNSIGDKIATYSNNQLGDIENIDVSNPLKNLILHKNHNTLVILDNTLSTEQNSTLNLTDANLYNTSAYTYSGIDNGIWFYDKELFQLIKIDISMNRIYESGNLLRLLNKDSLIVTKLLERRNKLYVSTKHETLVFDNYGAYYSSIHHQNSNLIGIEDNIIYSKNATTIKAYNTKTFEEQIIDTNISDNAFVIYRKNKIYTMHKGQFSIYEVKQ